LEIGCDLNAPFLRGFIGNLSKIWINGPFFGGFYRLFNAILKKWTILGGFDYI
jgi:hypothetical protein